MRSFLWFVVAAIAEIGGCYCFWLWLRLQRDMVWVVPGVLMLVFFAYALTRVDSEFAGRTFAAYGGIYIIASLSWLIVVEKARPLASDWIGVAICLLGAAVIMLGPRWPLLNP